LFFFATLQTDYQVCKELRLFGFGNFLHARMQGSQREINAAMSHVNAAQAKATALGSTVSSAITGVGLVWVVLEVSHGALPLGDVALFLAAAIGLQGSLVGILQGVPQMQQALIGFGHFRSIVEGPPDLAIPTTAMPVPPLERAIRFEDVWFRYTDDQPWVLQDVNVSIAAHETTGIVGVNGSGKSTLVKLLCRFYDPTRGRVLWDGVDIRQFAPEALRNRMSVLLQDFGCYEFTVRENIALSDLGKARDDLSLQKAAAVADLNETIDALAHGYDTLLSRMFFPHETESPEQGVRLSGGEWQRLAVARVALRTEADLIVLDEMTSGLDPAAEEKVGIRMRELTAGRTTIVISHRLGSIRPAAEIVVLMQGQIAEHGTHAELVRLGGEYARLFELQAAPFRA
jgi:ATP-binding cassette subfamily B protein